MKSNLEVITDVGDALKAISNRRFDSFEISCLMDMASRFYVDTIHVIQEAGQDTKWCDICEVEYMEFHECIEELRDE